MFGFLKKKEEPKASIDAVKQSATAPGTDISHSPELIGQLKADHRKMLDLYGQISAAFEAENYARVSAKLDEFRSGLLGHLLTENLRLYIYLERSLAGDEINSDLIRGFRREMDGIGKATMNFLKKYEAIGVDKELAPAFAKDLSAVGKVLVERIEKEEQTLYPLYMPRY